MLVLACAWLGFSIEFMYTKLEEYPNPASKCLINLQGEWTCMETCRSITNG